MRVSRSADFSSLSLMLALNGKGVMEMQTFYKRLWQDTEGQDLVEYALMVGMVAVAA